MRFLVDNALSPALASVLREAGYDTRHVRDLGLQHDEDHVIFDRATLDDLIIISADTDFGTLLAARSAARPSVILFRGPGSRQPAVLARLLVANLPQLAAALEAGSVVTFEPSRIRVRALPIGSTRERD